MRQILGVEDEALAVIAVRKRRERADNLERIEALLLTETFLATGTFVPVTLVPQETARRKAVRRPFFTAKRARQRPLRRVLDLDVETELRLSCDLFEKFPRPAMTELLLIVAPPAMCLCCVVLDVVEGVAVSLSSFETLDLLSSLLSRDELSTTAGCALKKQDQTSVSQASD